MEEGESALLCPQPDLLSLLHKQPSRFSLNDIDLDGVEGVHNETERPFEAAVDGVTAVAEYRLACGVIIFTHTEVPPALEGQDVVNKLIRTALEYARAERPAVWPICPFVKGYIRRHPEFQDLVSPTPATDKTR